MIIKIEDKLYSEIVNILKNRNKKLYEGFKNVKIIEDIQNSTLQRAREIKTLKIKEKIKKSIKTLYKQNIPPTKYQINKHTNIAYITINKYYDEILKEIKKDFN